MPLTTAGRNNLLTSGVVGSANFDHLSLHTADPVAGNEVAGGAPAYARQPIAWDAAAAGQTLITGAETFDVPAGTTVVFSGIFDTLTVGTLQAYSGVGTGLLDGVATVQASDDIIRSDAHGLVDTNRVHVWAVAGEALPTGLSAGVAYFVVTATTDTFQLSATLGGAAINLSADGELAFQQTKPETFGSQGTFTVPDDLGIFDLTFA